ncbi:MAG: hypothetical protein LH615_08070 [Ferruginibacter sp.]|nr:hypothetical protein [Ferruginibacter sp.]
MLSQNNKTFTVIAPKRPFSLDYFKGMVETDGSFQIQGTAFKAIFKLSQKTNTNWIPLTQKYLESHGIPSKIKQGGSSPQSRASDLLVTGKNNVRKVIALLRSEPGTQVIFTGGKMRDFLLMEEFVKNLHLSTAQRLGIKKSMHKSNQLEPDLLGAGSTPRAMYESQLGLQPGQSIVETTRILNKIDDAYAKLQIQLRGEMQKGTLQVPLDSLSAVVDGDGGYYVYVGFKNPSKQYNKRWILWQGNFILSLEINSILTAEIFCYMLNITAPIEKLVAGQGVNTGKPTSVKVHVRKQEEVQQLLDLHKLAPLIGDSKNAELQTVITLRRLKAENSINLLENVQSLLKEMYRVSAISKKGRPRRLTLEEALQKAAIWLSNNK